MAERVSGEDLQWAATWLEAYNDGDEIDPRTGESDEQFKVARRVAEWLRAEADKREEDAEVRALLKRVSRPGDPRARRAARDVVRRQRAERSSS